MELRNVTRYYPKEMPYGEGIQYFRSEDDRIFMNPWTNSRRDTNCAFTLKVA